MDCDLLTAYRNQLRSQGAMVNCNGCGVDLDPTTEQINVAVDRILDTSLQDAVRTGGVCPLCGHSKEVPHSQRKSVQFVLLVILLLIGLGVAASIYLGRQTARAAVAGEAVIRLNHHADLVRLIGAPIAVKGGIQGKVIQDETGWSETTLTIPVHGPQADATVYVVGGKAKGPWVFTTLEVVIPVQRKKVDLIHGTIVEYDPAAYVEVHTQTAAQPEYIGASAAAPTMPGSHPCFYISLIGSVGGPQLGQCDSPLPMMASTAVDRFEVDLRYGMFIVRQTDLLLKDTITVPFTRTYYSGNTVHPNPIHAFGNNTSHPFDIAPLGSRNPYTYQILALEDSDVLYFDRVSKGTGYANSVFQHTETSTNFYKATQQWNGRGWTMRIADGSSILFPESYSAKNLAQGGAIEMTDSHGNKLELIRDKKRDLQEIKAPGGGFINFSYDDQSRITKASDNEGRWVTYQYSAAGMLTDTIASSGIQRHYDYDGLHMTSIRDESGRTLVKNSYHNGWLVRQETEAGTYSFEYESSPPYYFANQVTVTSPDGVKKTIEVTNFIPQWVKHFRQPY